MNININHWLPQDAARKRDLIHKYTTDGRSIGCVIDLMLKNALPDEFVQSSFAIRTVKPGEKTIDFRRSKNKGAKRDASESELIDKNKFFVVFTDNLPELEVYVHSKSEIEEILTHGHNHIISVDKYKENK